MALNDAGSSERRRIWSEEDEQGGTKGRLRLGARGKSKRRDTERVRKKKNWKI